MKAVAQRTRAHRTRKTSARRQKLSQSRRALEVRAGTWLTNVVVKVFGEKGITIPPAKIKTLRQKYIKMMRDSTIAELRNLADRPAVA